MSNAVAIIPARGGSKRIPRKNIKLFCGKPLIAYSIEVALASGLFSKVIVTTDDEEIAKVARKYGAETPFIRPKEFSDDFSTSGDAVTHALEYLQAEGEEFEYVCTLYATAPFIQVNYLKEGFKVLKNSDAKMAFSVTSMPFPIQRTFKLTKEGRCQMFTPEHFRTRSQDLEEAYQDAGQFYWERVDKEFSDIPFGKDSIPIVLPRELVQDIDTPEDFRRAELMYTVLDKMKKKTKTILFRADSSSEIGTGHIMRDLVLAKKFQDSTIIFACQELEGNLIEKIPYPVKRLKSNDIEELDILIKKLSIDMLVIDHYEIDYNLEKKLKTQNPKLKIFVLDDMYEKHYCDILLNHNLCADASRYKDLVPKECELRCGSEYTLLRDEFYAEKELKREKIYDVFIAMGGADSANLNQKILELLPTNFKVVVVTTVANKHLDALKKYIAEKKNIFLEINSIHIAKLMHRSKLAIVTPSVTVNEVHYIGLEFIAIKTAENQIEIYNYLHKKKYPVLSSFDAKRLKGFIQEKLI